MRLRIGSVAEAQYGSIFWPGPIGTISVSAAASTPGTARAFSTTFIHAARVATGLSVTVGDTAIRAVNTCSTRMPGSSVESRNTVRPSIPAQTNSTTASPISATTNPLCSRRELSPTVRIPPRNFCSSSRVGARSAGATPNNNPHASEMPVAKSSTRQSSATSFARGKFPGHSARNGRMPVAAISTPNKPPASPEFRSR